MSFSAFSFLFSEQVRFYLKNKKDPEEALHALGVRLGRRYLDLFAQNYGTRFTPEKLLAFLGSHVWKVLFKKPLEFKKQKSGYVLVDSYLMINKHIWVPPEYGSMNCGEFAAGICEGMMTAAGFPCECRAHTMNAQTRVGSCRNTLISLTLSSKP